MPYRFTKFTDRAFDYSWPEVRAYHLALIREVVERYDCDGIELDWMRFGFHLRPGHEMEDALLLTEFIAEVRSLLDVWSQRRGRRIALSARVPSRPQTALRLGMDAITWARRGLLDRLVITPFWETIETDMPVEVWRAVLEGSGVELAAGFEMLLRPYPAFSNRPTNSLETVRGAAAAFLNRGVDSIYLFNYFDSMTAMDDLGNYPVLLREIGSLATLQGKPRRHVLTYADTWAPGEPPAIPLPTPCPADGWCAWRLPTGPTPAGEVTVMLGLLEGTEDTDDMEVRLNGTPCPPCGRITLPAPAPPFPVYGFTVPREAMQCGEQVIEVHSPQAVTFGWVEISVHG